MNTRRELRCKSICEHLFNNPLKGNFDFHYVESLKYIALHGH